MFRAITLRSGRKSVHRPLVRVCRTRVLTWALTNSIICPGKSHRCGECVSLSGISLSLSVRLSTCDRWKFRAVSPCRHCLCLQQDAPCCFVVFLLGVCFHFTIAAQKHVNHCAPKAGIAFNPAYKQTPTAALREVIYKHGLYASRIGGLSTTCVYTFTMSCFTEFHACPCTYTHTKHTVHYAHMYIYNI